MVVPETVRVDERQAARAKLSARIALSAANRSANHPGWARRLLAKASEARPTRLSNPKIKGGSVPLGKRGSAWDGATYFTVLIVSATFEGLEGPGVGPELEKVHVASGGSPVLSHVRSTRSLKVFRGFTIMVKFPMVPACIV